MSNSDYQRWARKVNEQARRAMGEQQKGIDRVNRENKRRVDDYNSRLERERKRRVDEYNRRVDKANREQKQQVDAYNRHVDSVNQRNRQVDAHNKSVIANLTRRLNSTQYSPAEEQLARRVAEAIAVHDDQFGERRRQFRGRRKVGCFKSGRGSC